MLNAILIVLTVQGLFAGLKQSNFLETTIKGKGITVPVLTNDYCHAHGWSSFVNDRPLASAWIRDQNGSENAFVLSRYSMSIRAFSTKISFGDVFSGNSVVNGMRDFKIDEDGCYYLYLPEGKYSDIQSRVCSDASKIDRIYTQKGAVAAFGVLNDWVGGVKSKYLFAVDPAANFRIWDLVNDKQGASPKRISIDGVNGAVTGAYSDGKLNAVGEFEIFLWGGFFDGSNIIQCFYNPISNTLRSIRTTMTVSGNPPGYITGKVPTSGKIAQLIQFWVGENDWRFIVRLTSNNFLSLNRDGQVIEAPIVTSINGGKNNVSPQPIGTVYSMSSCNGRKSWSYCSDILLFEDFSKSGQGIRRMEWVPDGYAYNLPVEVWMKESSTEGNISKPYLYLKNRSTWKSAKGIKIRIWHSRAEQETQTIKTDLYYSSIPGATVIDGVSPSNGNITYTDVIYPSSFELDPGDSTSADGLQLGIHFTGYYPGIWDRLNDWSWVNSPSNSFAVDPNICVYVLGSDGTYGKVFGNDPPSNFVRSPKNVTSANILSMEDPQFWSYPLTLSQSSAHTQGNWGLQIAVSGFNVMQSMPFSITLAQPQSLSMDILVDAIQTNPYWVGDVQLQLNIPSIGIQNAYLGRIDLTNLKRGQFVNCTIPIAAWLSTQLASSYSDASISISVNGNTLGSPLVFDNIHFQ